MGYIRSTLMITLCIVLISTAEARRGGRSSFRREQSETLKTIPFPKPVFRKARGFRVRPRRETWRNAIKKMFFIEVNNIRRGLPTIVSDQQFFLAMNVFAKYSPSFRSRNLNRTKYLKRYSLYETLPYGSWAYGFLLHFNAFPVHFLTTNLIKTLPPMSAEEKAHVYRAWRFTEQKLLSTPRGNYTFDDFTLPKNVHILYDSKRNLTCEQYNRFGEVNSNNSYSAPKVAVVLITAAIRMFHAGVDRAPILQMLSHFIAFTFNGVRCKRVEGNDLRIPIFLVHSYSRHLGYLSTLLPQKTALPRLSEKVVQSVFASEIDLFTSFRSWGNLKGSASRESLGSISYWSPENSLLDESNYKTILHITAEESNSTAKVTAHNSIELNLVHRLEQYGRWL